MTSSEVPKKRTQVLLKSHPCHKYPPHLVVRIPMGCMQRAHHDENTLRYLVSVCSLHLPAHSEWLPGYPVSTQEAD